MNLTVEGSVKVNRHAEYVAQRSFSSKVIVPMHTQTSHSGTTDLLEPPKT